MSNPNQKDDKSTDDLFDASYKPAAPGKKAAISPEQKRKRLLKALLIVAIAEGIVIGIMLPRAWPAAQPVDKTVETGATLMNRVDSVNPSFNLKYNLYVGRSWYGYVQEYQSFLSWPLHQRPAGFTFAEIVLRVNSPDYTWWNISLVSGTWDFDTITWNNRPTVGQSVANLSIPMETESLYTTRLRFNVTDLVQAGTNLSLCFTAMFNTSSYGYFVYDMLVWHYTVIQAGLSNPAFVFCVVASIGFSFVFIPARDGARRFREEESDA